MTISSMNTLCASIIATCIFAIAPVAYAQTPHLEVTFNPNPIFGAHNFIPGDSATGTATVTNNSGTTQTVLTSTSAETDADGLGSILQISIKQGSDVLYTNTLAHFFAQEISLGTLGNGQTTTYTYTVTFPEISGNESQKDSLGFDLCVGFASAQGYVCGTQISDGEDDDGNGDNGGGNGGGSSSGGPGGGGIIGSSPLKIQNERVDGITLPQATAIGNPDGTAIIRWETYRNGHLEPATSQVVYGLKTHGNGTPAVGYPYSINLTQPNFGYPLATVEDPAMVTHHSMMLTGLEVGGTYVYRVVSHASPATVSYEHAFTIPYGHDTERTSDDMNGGMGGDATTLLADGGTVHTERYGQGGEGILGEENTREESPAFLEGIVGTVSDVTQNGLGNLLGAAIGSLPAWLQGPLTCAFWFIIIVLIILALQRLHRAYTKKQGTYDPRVEKYILLWMILDLVAIVVLLLVRYFCPIIPLALLFVGLAFWYVWRTHPRV